MSNRLNNLGVSFSMKEDRLLMTIGASDGTSARLWLTRRFVRLMWQALTKILEGQRDLQERANPEIRQAILAMQNEAVAQADAISERRENVDAKIAEGPPPALAIGMRYMGEDQARQKGQEGPKGPKGPKSIVRVVFQTDGGPDITIALNTPLLHSLRQLLARSVAAAEWDLALEPGHGDPPAPDAIH